MDKRMKDSGMSLSDRINHAINRITKGDASMRIPVEATDPDVVLADCEEEIKHLRERLREAETLVRDFNKEHIPLPPGLRKRARDFLEGD